MTQTIREGPLSTRDGFMKITYVSHACLVVETEDLRLAFDPWLDGAAYAISGMYSREHPTEQWWTARMSL